MPFSRASSQPRDWICVFCDAGKFFTIWTIYLSHLPWCYTELIHLREWDIKLNTQFCYGSWYHPLPLITFPSQMYFWWFNSRLSFFPTHCFSAQVHGFVSFLSFNEWMNYLVIYFPTYPIKNVWGIKLGKQILPLMWYETHSYSVPLDHSRHPIPVAMSIHDQNIPERSKKLLRQVRLMLLNKYSNIVVVSWISVGKILRMTLM